VKHALTGSEHSTWAAVCDPHTVGANTSSSATRMEPSTSNTYNCLLGGTCTEQREATACNLVVDMDHIKVAALCEGESALTR
jgi:hypothetical protein